MTKAAFQATFTDWKLIRGRKVVQLVFEVPLEGADAAYNALGGMPDPGKSVWCAIAKLREPRGGDATADKETEEPITEKPEPEAAPLVRATHLIQQAGICCNDPRFWAFLRENEIPCENEDDAVLAVRFICHVKSRREFLPFSRAGDEWEKLNSRFIAWRDVPDAA